MEIFTVDETNNFRRGQLIEHYESFIWTDRYAAYGDFTLVCEASQAMWDRLKPDVLVGFTESDRLMRIESQLRTADKSGAQKITIKGKSVEAVFEGRAAKRVLSAATWDLTANIGAIIVSMVQVICVNGTGIHADDVIPGMTTQNTVPGSVYTVKVKAGTLYERIKELADTFDIGFRVTYVTGVNNLKFQTYQGTDRTGLNGVAFSPSLENLGETSSFYSKEDFKTGAYVFSNFSNALVGTTGDTGLLGLKRRIILVDATDVAGPADAAHASALQQRGRDALSEHQKAILYDGVINEGGPYIYNQHYFLGDLVDLIGDYNSRQKMRVTEHIWSYDRTGLKSYPTLRAIGGV